jgi:type IV fimbrial biogenesis protein FimT
MADLRDAVDSQEVGDVLVNSRSQRGFSIIELSVAMTIAVILLSLGAPAMSSYLQNARLGTQAQGLYGGLQTARAEAVKRNQDVEFVLTNSPLESTTADTITADGTGRNWVVRQRASASAPYVLVEQKAAATDIGGVAVAASAPVIVFNSLGGSNAGGPVTIALTNPTLGACAPAGPVRCWSIVVAAGGQVRLCNPDTSLASTDSRACN